MRRAACFMALAVAVSGFALQAQQIQVSPSNRTLSVTTSAEAKVNADVARIQVGYQLYGPTSDAVTDAAGKTSRAIAAALTGAGVPPDAIESEGQSTGPAEPYATNNEDAAERAQRKFMAQQSWRVRVPAAEAARVLAVATAAGANQSGNIEWTVSNEDALSAEAASRALQKARALAEQMAAGLNVHVGMLVYASNQADSFSPAPMMRNAILGGMGSGAAVREKQKELNLSPPEITRSATVTAIFAIQ